LFSLVVVLVLDTVLMLLMLVSFLFCVVAF